MYHDLYQSHDSHSSVDIDSRCRSKLIMMRANFAIHQLKCPPDRSKPRYLWHRPILRQMDDGRVTVRDYRYYCPMLMLRMRMIRTLVAIQYVAGDVMFVSYDSNQYRGSGHMPIDMFDRYYVCR